MTAGSVNLGDSENVGMLNIICQCCQGYFYLCIHLFMEKWKAFDIVCLESHVGRKARGFSALSLDQDWI